MSTVTKTTASTGTKKPTTKKSTVIKKADAIMEQMLEIPSFANNEFEAHYSTTLRAKRKKKTMNRVTVLLFVISIFFFLASVGSVLYASHLIRGM